MNFQDIKEKLLKSIEKLFSEDLYLIKNDISERAISHKLAAYLAPEFDEFDVDCEYNGYVNADNDRKYIYILKQKAEELDIIRDKDGDNELIYRAVFPDIIVHKRGHNTEELNLLIIEMKKSTSQTDGAYDEEKLSRYTSNDNENNLNYKLGAFIFIIIDKKEPIFTVNWYADGARIDL